MTTTLSACERLLGAAGYDVIRPSGDSSLSLAFESKSVLGFVHLYESSEDLIENWSRDQEDSIRRFSFVFRRAERKAWNVYAIFLSSGPASDDMSAVLNSIEEDLSATRKIVRAGIETDEGVRAALLPLLPIQNAPHLEPVDVELEIRARAQDVPDAALDAFFEGLPVAEVLRLMGPDK